MSRAVKATKTKDRFGRSRAKLARIAAKGDNADNLDDFLEAYKEFVAYSATLKEPFLTGDKNDDAVLLAAIGTAAEAGELLDVFKKIYFHDSARRGTMSKARRERFMGEAGDVCWYFILLLRLVGHRHSRSDAVQHGRAHKPEGLRG